MKRYTWKDYLFLALAAAIIGGFLILILPGCATVTIERDAAGNISGVTSTGFLRTAELQVKYKEGPVDELRVGTSSQTGEIAKEGNTVLGTLINGAKDLIP